MQLIKIDKQTMNLQSRRQKRWIEIISDHGNRILVILSMRLSNRLVDVNYRVFKINLIHFPNTSLLSLLGWHWLFLIAL